MKFVVSLVLATAMILTLSTGSWATLFDRGGGMIYDDVLNITWLQDANLAATNTFGVGGINADGTMSWNTAQAWIAAMNTANYLGFSDWRLPTTPDAGGPFVFGWDGIQPYSYNYGYNMTTSEMGYMFYVNLGNVGLRPTNYNGGSVPDRSPGTFGLANVGPFQNFGQPFPTTLAIPYWSGTQSVNQPTAAWYFDFYYGNLGPGDITGTLNNQFYAWAVRAGDVCNPVPVERDTTYTINSDASFTYTADYTYRNDCSEAEPVVIGFSVLFHGATVTTNNFDSFTFDGEDPGYFNEYGADFDFVDPQEVPRPITVNYDADGYTFTGHIDPGETKKFTISYSGPAGVWSKKSINPAFPWTDQTGWWELIGDGHADFDNFKVTVNLPSNTATYKVMGYDLLAVPLSIVGNQFIFISNTAGGKLDEDILFKTTEPLPVATSVSLNCLAPGVTLVNTPLQISGTISPAVGSLSVLIDYTSPTGIKTTNTVLTDGAGSFSDNTFTPTELGPWTILARLPAQGFYLPSQSAPCSVIVYARSSGGSFVIGDGSAAVGQKVSFWGAQWWKANILSGGAAPASFKGFENMPATPPPCGGTWSTDPGNSSGPPSSIPSYMAVIVSSAVTKHGSMISGNTQELVVVKTNPGYAPNPGHAGTGTVVAVICP